MTSHELGLGAVLLLLSYVLGSIPMGYWLVKATKGIDLREQGSGSLGATNVVRVAGKGIGLTAFLFDVLKGFLPPFGASQLGLNGWWGVAAGIVAIAGHVASPFIGFKGGKGIATALGVLFGLSPLVALSAWGIWAVFFFTSGFVSLASIAAAIVIVPLTLWLYPGDPARITFAVVAGGLSLYKHRANIVRLAKGQESRMLYTKKAPPRVEDQPGSPE